MTLAERLLALHDALDTAELPHAFGGAIALAYATEEPRGTRDLDVNVFVPAAEAARVLAGLPDAIASGEDDRAALEHDGQRRLFWAGTPIDVFLDYAPLHARAARNRRLVPFEGCEIPVLGPVELAVFKALFDRTKDWADIEAMIASGALVVDTAEKELAGLVGADDHRTVRLAGLAPDG